MRLLGLAFLLAVAARAGAQVYVDPLPPIQNPPGVDWRVIRTPHFEIIFPRDVERDAQRVANTLEHVRGHVSRTLGVEPRPLSVVLQTRRAESNGFVTLAPRRTEWLGPPPQASDLLGANDWYDLLALHEFRHVVQFDASNRGLTRLFYYLFGETAWQLLTGISVPSWYLEGDAVGIETALTGSGRGRIGEFDQTLRAIRRSGRRDPYWKAMWGSYDDFVPSAYVMGYAVTTHVRRKYGADAWRKVLERTARFSFLPNAFSLALRQVVHRSAPQLYADAMAELDSVNRARLAGVRLTDAELLTRPTRGAWTSNLHPRLAADGSVIVLRSGYEDVPQFVRIDPTTGAVERLAYAGQRGLSEPFGVGASLLAWTETRADPRWGQRSWSVVRTLDLLTRRVRTLTERSRYFAPDVSPTDDRIVVVEITPANRSAIVVLDATTGRELARLDAPPGATVQTPRWSPDGRSIVYSMIERGKGRAIAVADVASGETRLVVPHTMDNVASPTTDGRWVYYSAPYTGIDEIHATSLATGRTFQVTSRPIGATSPEVARDGATLIFAEVTADGLGVFRQPIDTAAWVPAERVARRSEAYLDPIIAQEGGTEVLSGVPDERYPVRPYRPLGHAFNVFGWAAYTEPDDRIAALAVYSQDKLGTLRTSLGWLYNYNERTHGGFAAASYGGLYPMIDLGVRHGERSTTYDDSTGSDRLQSWRETGATLGVRLPLDLTRGLYSTTFSAGASTSLVRVSGQEFQEPLDNGNGDFVPVTYELAFTRAYRWVRDINPVWGQYAFLTYSHTPFRSDFRGAMLSGRTFLFAPGPLPHHSLWLRLGYERQSPDNYVFSRLTRFPRGYSARTHRYFYDASANYTLPLLYPDLNALGALHIKRVRGNAFYDYGEGQNSARRVFHYRSAGVELGADLFLFSYPFPLFGGVRVVKRFDGDRRTVVEPVVGLPF